MHEGHSRSRGPNVVDPYHWVENPTEAQEAQFVGSELRLTQIMLYRYLNLERQLLQEF